MHKDEHDNIPEDNTPAGDMTNDRIARRTLRSLGKKRADVAHTSDSEARGQSESGIDAGKRSYSETGRKVSETSAEIGKKVAAAGTEIGKRVAEQGAELGKAGVEIGKKVTDVGFEFGKKVKKKSKPWIDAIFGGDKVLWTIIIVLLIFSMLLTFSATVYKPGGTPTSKLIGQLVYIVLGIGALLVVHVVKYQFYGRIAKAIFILGLILTVLAMFIGPEGAGARRDLDIPLIHIRFQPFEILKIGLIMVLAKQLARRQKNIENTPVLPSLNPMSWVKDAQSNMEILIHETIPVFGPILITCIVTFLSVGNSTTLIVAATCFVMLFIGRVRLADLGKIVAMGAILLVIAFAAGLGRSNTGKSRIASFKPDMMTTHSRLNSDSIEVYSYPEEVTKSGKIIPEESSQSINAKMSIASGGFFGKGPGMSTHRSNLEEAEKDFAYAFIIEEYGALGGLVILLLYLWLFFRTIQIFKKCGTAFPSLLVLGLGLMIILQAMIHMLVSVALFPITGQQLPLISKGGSSLVFTLAALGMILGVSRQTAERTLDNPKEESLLERK